MTSRRLVTVIVSFGLLASAIAAPPALAFDPVAATERVTVDSSGSERPDGAGNGVNSTDISYDGRFVAFDATESFDPADSNGFGDVYVRDRQLGTTTVASLANGGGAANGFSFDPAISADAR